MKRRRRLPVGMALAAAGLIAAQLTVVERAAAGQAATSKVATSQAAPGQGATRQAATGHDAATGQAATSQAVPGQSATSQFVMSQVATAQAATGQAATDLPATAAAVATVAAGAPPGPAVGAPVDVASFRVARGIHPGPPALLSLPLDAAVLAHSASPQLADLRIVDGTGRQVPYVVERRAEPLGLELGAPRREARSGDAAGLSRYAVRLPYATLPAARLVIVTSVRAFERLVRLFGSEDAAPERPERPGRTLGPQSAEGGREPLVASAVWRHADPETAAAALTLDLPPRAGRRLTLVIDDGDNAPLPLVSARLLLPAYRLRYFPPAAGASLRLLYGDPGLGPPRYDLSLVAGRLLGDRAQEVSLGPEPPQDEADPVEARSRAVFWAVLAAAVAALLILLGRLLRAAPPAAGAG